MDIEDPNEAIRLLCALRSYVYRSWHSYAQPDDCFCPDVIDEKAGNMGVSRNEFVREYYRNAGEATRFIIQATLEKLERDA